MEPKILYEDDWLMVIDKPAGMVTNRAESVKGETVQDWTEDKLKIQKAKGKNEELFYMRSGVAHRLDKETSGVLVVAKTPEVLEKLLALFKNRQMQKEYLALVHGRLQPGEGTIKLPIGRDRWERKKRKVAVEGKVAETRWRVEQVCGGDSLVRLWPKTGRMHQIRVHLQFLGHPLVGDKIYASKNQRAADAGLTERHCLQAAAIEFIHPLTGKRLRVEAPLAPDLVETLSKIC